MRLNSRQCIWNFVSSIMIIGNFSCVSNSPTPCETDVECADGLACTVDACIDLFCRNTAVACPQGEVCVPTTGACEVGECTINSHCDDGVFCNGAETCDVASLTCGLGSEPCREDQICDGIRRRCQDVECIVDADCDDSDGCTTDQCDAAACSNTDLVCPSGQLCLEQTGTCIVSDCTTDADCDDGIFCNGLEFCRLLTRSCEPAPSEPCEGQNTQCIEALQECGNISCATNADCAQGQRCSISGGCVSL